MWPTNPLAKHMKSHSRSSVFTLSVSDPIAWPNLGNLDGPVAPWGPFHHTAKPNNGPLVYSGFLKSLRCEVLQNAEPKGTHAVGWGCPKP